MSSETRDGYNLFVMHNCLKNHWDINSNYNYFKYHGKSSKYKEAYFLKRYDRFKYIAIAKKLIKYNNYLPFFLSHINLNNDIPKNISDIKFSDYYNFKTMNDRRLATFKDKVYDILGQKGAMTSYIRRENKQQFSKLIHDTFNNELDLVNFIIFEQIFNLREYNKKMSNGATFDKFYQRVEKFNEFITININSYVSVIYKAIQKNNETNNNNNKGL